MRLLMRTANLAPPGLVIKDLLEEHRSPVAVVELTSQSGMVTRFVFVVDSEPVPARYATSRPRRLVEVSGQVVATGTGGTWVHVTDPSGAPVSEEDARSWFAGQALYTMRIRG